MQTVLELLLYAVPPDMESVMLATVTQRIIMAELQMALVFVSTIIPQQISRFKMLFTDLFRQLQSTLNLFQ